MKLFRKLIGGLAAIVVGLGGSAFAANFTQISVNEYYYYSNSLWGITDKGQAIPSKDYARPTGAEYSNLTKIASLGANSFIALNTSGRVVAWNAPYIPMEVLSGVVDIAAYSTSYLYALKSNGDVIYWGDNKPAVTWTGLNVKSLSKDGCQLAVRHDGTVINLYSGQIISAVGNVKKVTCSGDYVWYLLNDGQVVRYDSSAGYIYPHTEARYNNIDISSDYNYIFVLKADGKVVMADETTGNYVTPLKSGTLSNIKSLIGRYGIRQDGSVVGFTEQAMNSVLSSHHKRETADIDGDRQDELLTWIPTSRTMHKWVFNGRGQGFLSTSLGSYYSSETPTSKTGYFALDGDNNIGLIHKTSSNYYDCSFCSKGNFGYFNGLQLELVGDFNGDGFDDLVWRNPSTGSSSIGLYHTSPATYRPLGAYAANVNFEGVSDFDNNGYLDILFRNKNTGNTMIGLMNSTINTATPQITWKTISTIYANLNILAVQDFNLDGRRDVLVRNPSSGRVMIGFMDAAMNVSWADLITISNLDVKPIAVGDYDGDGIKDILWRNITNGNISITYVNKGFLSNGYVSSETQAEGNIPMINAVLK